MCGAVLFNPRVCYRQVKESYCCFVPKLTSFYDELSEEELLNEIPRLTRQLKAAETDLHKAMDWSLFAVLKFIGRPI